MDAAGHRAHKWKLLGCYWTGCLNRKHCAKTGGCIRLDGGAPVGLAALIYARLGFRGARAPQHESTFKGAHHFGNTVVFPLGWKDRLRVVISGKVEIDMLHQIDVVFKRWYTNADLAVLPPNEKLGADRHGPNPR